MHGSYPSALKSLRRSWELSFVFVPEVVLKLRVTSYWEGGISFFGDILPSKCFLGIVQGKGDEERGRDVV